MPYRGAFEQCYNSQIAACQNSRLVAVQHMIQKLKGV